MQSFCLTACRILIPAWVGAAVLFVVTSIAEQRCAVFDSLIRDHLALVRFPFYYAFGFTLVGAGFLCGLAARNHPAVKGKRATGCVVCLGLALALMAVDYVWVYQPLAALISPPGTARTAEFVAYHKASQYINEFSLALCLIATVLISLPMKSPAANSTDTK